jgi:hypothetical protein
MQFYSQYRLEDFYQKHYWQGGVTLNQVHVLYEQAIKRKNEEYRFFALLHGADPDADGTERQDNSHKQQNSQSLPLFQDPEKYSHLSKEERDELTAKMMGKHRNWANQKAFRS